MGLMKSILLWTALCCASVIGAVAAETTGPGNSPDVSHAVESSGSASSTVGEGHHGDSRIRYEVSRVQSFTDWWQMPLLVAVCAVVLSFVVYMYRRDSVELKPGFGVLLVVAAAGRVCRGAVDVFRYRAPQRSESYSQLARGDAGRHQPEHEPRRCRRHRFDRRRRSAADRTSDGAVGRWQAVDGAAEDA